MRLLVVDDDEQIREGIEKGIHWSEIGIVEVKTASNGIEALEIIKTFSPEIVLTDIRMPGMDGLELFKKIKEIKPSTKVIIISGYSDFNYLKTAIQYGAVDYELKPIRVKNLIALINKVKEDILKEKTTEENYKRYQKTYITNFIEDLIKGKITDRNIILEEMEKYFGFDARGVLLVSIFDTDSFHQGEKQKSADYYDELKSYFDKNPVSSSGQFLWKFDDKRTLLVIKTVNSMLYQNYLTNEIRRVFREINRDFEAKSWMTLSLGISGYGEVLEFAKLYREAEGALEYNFYTGKKSVNFYQNLNISDEPYKMTAFFISMLSRAIADFDINKVFELIESEFDKIQTLRTQSKKSISAFCLELMKFLNSTLKSKGYETIEQYDEKIKGSNYFVSLHSLEEFRNQVIEYYREILMDLNDEKKVASNKNILAAVEYIKKNYQEDLTVELVAQVIGKSPNYFSHVFKKEMQMPFTEYLNRFRIRKAKELFLSTDKLVYEVCREVGYQEYAYFTQLFKKYENCTPTEVKHSPL